MESGLDLQKSRPLMLMDSVLGSPNTVAALLTESEVKEKLIVELSNEVASFIPEESEEFISTLLDGLSRDDDIWDQDKRDAGLEILPLVDFEQISKGQLKVSYLKALSTQGADSDPYGSIYSLLEAGKIMAEHFPVDSEAELISVLMPLEDKFKGEDRSFIIRNSAQVLESIPKALGQGAEGQDKLGWRDHPELDPAEKSLHDSYLEVVGKSHSFKLTLWQNTPEFRSELQVVGLDLKRFWNLNNPDMVAVAVSKLSHQEAHTIAQFNKALTAQVGVNLDQLSEEEVKVVADEVVLAAFSARSEIIANLRNFDDVITKFKSIAAGIGDRVPRAQKAIAGQIINFFREMGVEAHVNNPSEVTNLLAKTGTLREAEVIFNQKQEEKRQSAEALTGIFNLDRIDQNYQLISRTREDLFLGDLTGDCTAYHLNTGMNAWTVPTWLSNPGFNIFKISEGNTLIAKLGLLLSMADGKPVLVIDSIETGKRIRDEEYAKTEIQRGLVFIRSWASGIGLENVFINTFSNSSDLVPIIENISTKDNGITEINVFGGLSGISELRKNITGQDSAQERTYLQAEEYEGDDEGMEEGWQEQEKILGEFEDWFAGVIDKTENEVERTNLENAAREQNWPEIFKDFISKETPFVNQVIGSDWQEYTEFMDEIEIDVVGNPHVGGNDDLDPDPSFPVHHVIEEEIVMVEPNYDSQDPRFGEADSVDDLLILLKTMEYRGLTVEAALRRLYGGTDSQNPDKIIKLRSTLPKLIS